MPSMPLMLDRAELAREIQRLPSPPAVVLRLLSLVGNDSPLEDLEEAMSLDQALSAKVLRLANSPFYGVSGRVTSIHDGIRILGTSQICCLALASAVTLPFEARYARSAQMMAAWQHSMACGVAARRIAQSCGIDDAAGFSVGLLHDVGRLILESHYPQHAAQANAWSARQGLPRHEAEQTLLGISHAEIGGWVCSHWGFAPEVVAAIGLHHNPGVAHPLADVAHVADVMAHALGMGGGCDVVPPRSSEEAWQRLRFTPDAALALHAPIEQEVQELVHHLKTP
ncbi:HDOD domain-containing protein [Delftia sp. PS-11]|uniref:HDOD domain-containing protein n=1 Tax=Delftia sp. PS-11 TaxID=2767222 RepID=UPI0024559B51|nr:HDOD domain-containing protein [Delftia sp. PS-11]